MLDITSARPFLVVTTLPIAVAVMTLPSFYVLARALPLTAGSRIAALIVFAAMPGALIPLIEGQGLAEAFGSLALIWLAIAMVHAWRQNEAHRYALVGLAGATAGLASPGSAYAAAPTLALFALAALYQGRGPRWRRRVGHIALAAAVSLVASSPYWLSVLAHHGPDVYIESVRAEHDHALYELAHWQVATRKAVSATFNDGSNAIWLLLLSAGALFSVVHRPYRPIVGWCAVLLAIPREGPWMAAIPGSMLIGIGVAEVGGSTLANARQRVTSRRLQPAAAIAAGVVGLLLTYSLFTNSTAAAIRDLVTGEEGLDDATVAAMRWVATETPGDARFVVVSRPQVREWSPQIMRRTVLNSVWGSEWVPQQAKQIGLFDAAVEACEDLPCVLAAATEQFGYEDVYLYIDRAHFVALAEQDTCVGPRIAAFEVLWENDAVTIARSARPGVDSECEPAALSGTTMNPRHPARYRFRDFVTGHYDAVAGIREAPALPTPSILPQ